MGRRFTYDFKDIASSAVADQLNTVLFVFADDTLGHRFFVSAFTLGFSDNAPTDVPVMGVLSRVPDISAGGVGTGTGAVTSLKRDTQQLATILTASEDHLGGGVEPTTYETGDGFTQEVNAHSAISELWDWEHTPIVLNRDEGVGVRVGPRNALAVRVSGSLTIEEH